MNFIIMFMGSPEYIRNPYLRAKMVEVLNCWMPRRRLFDKITIKQNAICQLLSRIVVQYVLTCCIQFNTVPVGHLLHLLFLKDISYPLSIW